MKLIDDWCSAGVTISYSDIQFLYDKWALENRNESTNISLEIVNSKAAVYIIDSDYFKSDTLFGQSKQLERKIFMLLQPNSIEKKPELSDLIISGKTQEPKITELLIFFVSAFANQTI